MYTRKKSRVIIHWSPDDQSAAREVMEDVVGETNIEVDNKEAKRIRVLYGLMTDAGLSLDEAKEHEDYQELLGEQS